MVLNLLKSKTDTYIVIEKETEYLDLPTFTLKEKILVCQTRVSL